jgi:hypothetical protein
MEYSMQRWIQIMTERKGEEGLLKIVEEHAETLGRSLAKWEF